jgi:hypothetical protein
MAVFYEVDTIAKSLFMFKKSMAYPGILFSGTRKYRDQDGPVRHS